MSEDHFWEIALRLRMWRSELIASNIANADTPNFKARDLDFKATLERTLSEGDPLEMTNTSPRQIPDEPERPEASAAADYRIPQQPSLDGNTVEIETERSAFVENAMRYQFTFDRAIDEYKEMINLFRSLSV